MKRNIQECRQAILISLFQKTTVSESEKRANERALKYLNRAPVNKVELRIHKEFLDYCETGNTPSFLNLMFWVAVAEGEYQQCFISARNTFYLDPKHLCQLLYNVAGDEVGGGVGLLASLNVRSEMREGWKKFFEKTTRTSKLERKKIENRINEYNKLVGLKNTPVWALYMDYDNLVLFYHPAINRQEAKSLVFDVNGWFWFER